MPPDEERSNIGPSLLRALVLGHPDRLIIVGRIELGPIGAPRGVLEHPVDLAQPLRRRAKDDHLPDAHLDIPAHHLDPRRREGLVEALPRQLGVEFARRPRLVVLEEDGEGDGVVGAASIRGMDVHRDAVSPATGELVAISFVETRSDNLARDLHRVRRALRADDRGVNYQVKTTPPVPPTEVAFAPN
jgi:hypothetical protein